MNACNFRLALSNVPELKTEKRWQPEKTEEHQHIAHSANARGYHRPLIIFGQCALKKRDEQGTTKTHLPLLTSFRNKMKIRSTWKKLNWLKQIVDDAEYAEI